MNQTFTNQRPVDGSLLAGREKENYIGSLFNRIATGYDSLNRWISLGQDLAWRKQALDLAEVQPGMRAVDLGTGTGDLYLLLQERVGPTGKVIGIDLAENMLQVAREKSQALYPERENELRQGRADETGLPDESADVVTMGWVLRNVGDRANTYREVLRILKPGGCFVCVDMSQPQFAPLRWGHSFYLNWLMPTFVRLTGGDHSAYVYLANSTARFPNKAELAEEWQQAGFSEVQFRSLMLGGIGLHVGQKPTSSGA